MAEKLQPVRGTHDLLPDEFEKFFSIQQTARAVVGRYGFREMATPIFEFTDVFARTMGETSDVVNKEMYSFLDRGDESITLRPEFTAGIVRALISNGLQQSLPLKLFTTGPVFRYERPQKGRQRQFHQLNCEFFGSPTYSGDYLMVGMANELLKELKIEATLHINSLGDAESRAAHREALVAYFSKYKNDLSEDSKIRLEKNPLRILDSKDESDKKLCVDAPKLSDSLNAESKEFFNNLKYALSKMGFDFVEDSNLVRGLDYYNHTVFEFKSSELGAQDTILAGGRYDGLVAQMGGSPTPAVGWGAGIERLMLLADIPAKQREVYVIILANEDQRNNVDRNLRAQGKIVEIAQQNNVGKALKKADNIGASFAILLNNDGKLVERNLKTGEQTEISL